MNNEFDMKTRSLHGHALYGIQTYWLSDFPFLYNAWYDWYGKTEPAQSIAGIMQRYIPKRKEQLRILDCACGTGNPSLSLVRDGYNVTCSDGSAHMLGLIAENASRIGVAVDVVAQPVLWEQLCEYFGENHFDAVICSGNSLCHLPPAGVRYAVTQMSAMLDTGGLLIADSKKYNETIHEMYYSRTHGWTERSERLDKREVDGRIMNLLTRLSYFGQDRPGRNYRVNLETWAEEEHGYHTFSVWATTSAMIAAFMERSGIYVLPLCQAHCDSPWQYDISIGIKR